MKLKVIVTAIVMLLSSQAYSQGSLQATANYARNNAVSEEFSASYWWQIAKQRLKEAQDKDDAMRQMLNTMSTTLDTADPDCVDIESYRQFIARQSFRLDLWSTQRINARADDIDDAFDVYLQGKTAYALGVQAYNRGDFGEAVNKFNTSLTLYTEAKVEFGNQDMKIKEILADQEPYRLSIKLENIELQQEVQCSGTDADPDALDGSDASMDYGAYYTAPTYDGNAAGSMDQDYHYYYYGY